jgi:XTP/dITP diphosphohydrolase
MISGMQMAEPSSVGRVARRVVLATRNAGKIAELDRILVAVGTVIDIVGLDEFPDAPDVPETGLTFADNALLKARAIAAYTGLPAVADDSGLAVDALHGMPGVLSARWAGKHGDDHANLELVLGQLGDVHERGAAFICVAALVVPDHDADGGAFGSGAVGSGAINGGAVDGGGREWTTTGVLAGALIRAPRGTNGFGYDPIFVPEGRTVTTAELAPAEKDAISHRGRAFRAMAPLIAAHA